MGSQSTPFAVEYAAKVNTYGFAFLLIHLPVSSLEYCTVEMHHQTRRILTVTRKAPRFTLRGFH